MAIRHFSIGLTGRAFLTLLVPEADGCFLCSICQICRYIINPVTMGDSLCIGKSLLCRPSLAAHAPRTRCIVFIVHKCNVEDLIVVIGICYLLALCLLLNLPFSFDFASRLHILHRSTYII